MLDLLRVAVEAGLSPGRALGEVGRRRRGVLARRAARGAARGSSSASRARGRSRGSSARCPLPGIAALTAAIGRADRHGAPLAPALAALAAEARGAGTPSALRERAARAAPQIQLVVALLLVPAVMLLVAAALASALA